MHESRRDYLLLNDGTGVFTTADAVRFPEDSRSDFTIQAVDLDRDGDLDVLAPSTVFPRVESEFLLFTADPQARVVVVRASELDTRDVDGDGDLDVVVKTADRSATYLSEKGRFVAAPGQAAWPAQGRLEDLDDDGDGRLDLALGRIGLGDVTGRESDDSAPEPAVPPPVRTRSMQVADLDRDGDVDVVVLSTLTMAGIGQYLALVNDGSGRFSAAAPGTVLPDGVAGNGFDVEVADFDRDGVEDLFLCNRASIGEPGSTVDSGGVQRLLLGAARTPR